jgi:hypothetical protein
MSIRALPLSLAERQRLNRFDELCREVMAELAVDDAILGGEGMSTPERKCIGGPE